MESRRSRKARKENKKLFEKVYLDDPEYRAILIRKIVKEDSVMLDIVDNLTKLFQEEDGQ